MKSKLTILVVAFIGAAVMTFCSGCYTQLSSSREEDRGGGDEYSSKQYNNEDSSAYYANDDNYYQSHYGFSYYYPPYAYGFPSYSFNAAYNDPWLYAASGYYGGYYPSYGYGYYYPSYCYGSYYPYYGCYSTYYPYYSSFGNPLYHRTRTFGATRENGNVRTTVNASGYSSNPNQSGYGTGFGTMPTGTSASRVGGSSTRGNTTSNVNTSRQRGGSQRVSSPPQSGDQRHTNRGMGSRGSNYNYSRRDTRPQHVPSEGGNQGHSQGSRESGTTRSAPPPSNSGQGQSRSGGSQGRRP